MTSMNVSQPPAECVLCDSSHLDDRFNEQGGSTPAGHHMNRVMDVHRRYVGRLPNEKVYAKVLLAYNQIIREPVITLNNARLVFDDYVEEQISLPPVLTMQMIQAHFELHAGLWNERQVVADDLRAARDISASILGVIAYSTASRMEQGDDDEQGSDAPPPGIDMSAVSQFCKVSLLKRDLIKFSWEIQDRRVKHT